MGVKCDISGFRKNLREIPNRLELKILSVLSTAGKNGVEKARATKTYQDQTGALTASIGYGVVKNGTLVEVGGFGGGEGGKTGRAYLEELAQNIHEWGLIIVAGRDYAIYVERKGFVVLDGGALGLGNEIEKMLKEIEL